MEKFTEKEQAVIDAVQKSIDDKTKGLITEEAMGKAIAKALTELKVDITADPKFKELETTIKNLGIEFTAIKEHPQSSKFKSIREQIKDQLAEKKAEMDAFTKNPNGSFTLNLKVAGSMLNSTNLSGNNLPVAEVEAGITMPIVRPLNLLARVNRGRTGAAAYQYIQGVNRDGNAAIINDATVAPLVDFDLASTVIAPIDSVGATNVHVNMLNDIEGLESEIQSNLQYECYLAAENNIGTYLTGIIAGAFADPGLDFTTPNNFDALLACAAQIKAANGQADTAVLNPVDFAQMVGSKGSDGHYVMPPFSMSNGQSVAGLTLIESNAITAGNVLVYDSSKVRVLDYQDLEITFGWDGANGFRDRIVTILGILRFYRFVKSNHTALFIYDSFEDIIAAITAV